VSEPEKPLHVQVAEALGHQVMAHWPEGKAGPVYYSLYEGGDTPPVRRYDTDWSATGPLIEKYQACIEACSDGYWSAYNFPAGMSKIETFGATPLIAVCNLILALKASGQLP
jgi:hypothetical protein